MLGYVDAGPCGCWALWILGYVDAGPCGGWGMRRLDHVDVGSFECWAVWILGRVDAGPCRCWALWMLGLVDPGPCGCWAVRKLGRTEAGPCGGWGMGMLFLTFFLPRHRLAQNKQCRRPKQPSEKYLTRVLPDTLAHPTFVPGQKQKLRGEGVCDLWATQSHVPCALHGSQWKQKLSLRHLYS